MAFISIPLASVVNSGSGVVVGGSVAFFSLSCMNKSALNQQISLISLLQVTHSPSTFQNQPSQMQISLTCSKLVSGVLLPVKWWTQLYQSNQGSPLSGICVNHKSYLASSLFSGTAQVTPSSSLLQREPSAAPQNEKLQGSFTPLHITHKVAFICSVPISIPIHLETFENSSPLGGPLENVALMVFMYTHMLHGHTHIYVGVPPYTLKANYHLLDFTKNKQKFQKEMLWENVFLSFLCIIVRSSKETKTMPCIKSIPWEGDDHH